MFQKPNICLFSPTILALHCRKWLQGVDLRLYYHQYESKCDKDDDGGGGGNVRGSRQDGECHFQLYKSRGQHLLTNARVIDAIVKASNIRSSDTVLEIGPGTGNLTLRLLKAAHKVVAVELDGRMAETLEKRVAECGLEDKLTLIRKDALKTEFPYFDLVVANIPYGISSPLIAKLVFGTNPFRSATLLLQKEFACRLLANPGDSEFNRLAVNVKLVAEVEHVMDVSKREFLPVPKVDSSVVVIRPKVEIPKVDLNEWCAFTRTCFSKKNKTLGATFKQKKKLVELMRISNLMGLNKENSTPHEVFSGVDKYEDAEDKGGNHINDSLTLFKEKVVGILKSNGFEDKRPSKLSIEELLHLLSLLNNNGIYFHDKEDETYEKTIDSFEL